MGRWDLWASMSLPELHCDPMQRSTRITEANTTVPGLRICLLGWLHRSYTVGIHCHDVIAFSYSDLSKGSVLLKSFGKTAFPQSPKSLELFDFFLLPKLCFTP